MMLTDLIKHILIGWQSNYLFPFSPLSEVERGLSLSNHLQIFINYRSAQITNPREFAHIHLTCDSPINNQSFYCTMFRCEKKKSDGFSTAVLSKDVSNLFCYC